VLSFLAFYVLLHVAAHAYPRYRLPAMPALSFSRPTGSPAGRRARDPREPSAHAGRRGRLGLVLALSVAPSLVGWFTKPWPPPWFEGMGVESGAPTNDERPEGR
jgi:hypothetical protein